MELSGLLSHRHMANGKKVITHLGRVKLAFTISSLGYCAVHWVIFHGFSAYVISGAVVFGAFTATLVARISSWLSSS